MFLNTHIGFLHLSFETAHSWEPPAAISCTCCTRCVEGDSQCQLYPSHNTQAIRHIAHSFNLHQNLPVCQIPATEWIRSSCINVFPYTTPHTHAIFLNVAAYNEIFTWLGLPCPCCSYLLVIPLY